MVLWRYFYYWFCCFLKAQLHWIFFSQRANLLLFRTFLSHLLRHLYLNLAWFHLTLLVIIVLLIVIIIEEILFGGKPLVLSVNCDRFEPFHFNFI